MVNVSCSSLITVWSLVDCGTPRLPCSQAPKALLDSSSRLTANSLRSRRMGSSNASRSMEVRSRPYVSCRRVLPRGWGDFGLQLAIWFGFLGAYQVARGLADRNPPKAFENGLRALCMLTSYREQYVAIVKRLARRIVDVAERYPLGPSRATAVSGRTTSGSLPLAISSTCRYITCRTSSRSAT